MQVLSDFQHVMLFFQVYVTTGGEDPDGQGFALQYNQALGEFQLMVSTETQTLTPITINLNLSQWNHVGMCGMHVLVWGVK